MRFDDTRTEWRISDIERKLEQKVDKYEIHLINSNVDSLERTVRELSSTINELRYELESLQGQIRELQPGCGY